MLIIMEQRGHTTSDGDVYIKWNTVADLLKLGVVQKEKWISIGRLAF